jgi:hypothetical protein
MKETFMSKKKRKFLSSKPRLLCGNSEYMACSDGSSASVADTCEIGSGVETGSGSIYSCVDGVTPVGGGTGLKGCLSGSYAFSTGILPYLCNLGNTVSTSECASGNGAD